MKKVLSSFLVLFHTLLLWRLPKEYVQCSNFLPLWVLFNAPALETPGKGCFVPVLSPVPPLVNQALCQSECSVH